MSTVLISIGIGIVIGVVLTLWWASRLPAPPASREEIREDRVRADSITAPLLAQAERDLAARPRVRAVTSLPNLMKGTAK